MIHTSLASLKKKNIISLTKFIQKVQPFTIPNHQIHHEIYFIVCLFGVINIDNSILQTWQAEDGTLDQTRMTFFLGWR